MGTLSPHHEALIGGVGKCSVPMWRGGMPAGFCDRDAYGKQRKPHSWERYPNELAYASGLCCEGHGGPPRPSALEDIVRNLRRREARP